MKNIQINKYTNKQISRKTKILNSLFVLFYLFIGLFVYSFITASAGAADCEPIYGGGPTCTDTSFSIQKQVLNPVTNKFVHNLGIKDPQYHGNDLVTFQVTLTNNGDKPFQSVIIKDTFPTLTTFTDGPGKFDPTSNVLTFSVSNLAPHHSQLFTMTAKVLPESKLPGQKTTCVTNSVSGLPSSGSVAQDSSQFCITRLTTSPATGPEALGLVLLVPTALAGFGIRKLGRK